MDLVAWDLLLCLALIFAVPVFRGPGLSAAVRAGLNVGGGMCLAGLLGPALARLALQRLGIPGYRVVSRSPACCWQCCSARRRDNDILGLRGGQVHISLATRSDQWTPGHAPTAAQSTEGPLHPCPSLQDTAQPQVDPMDLRFAHLADYASADASGKLTVVGVFDFIWDNLKQRPIPFPRILCATWPGNCAKTRSFLPVGNRSSRELDRRAQARLPS